MSTTMSMSQPVLVTGHRGYIGSRVFSRLKNLGCDVDGVDLKDGEDLLYSLPRDKKYHTVFHLAALPRVEYSVLKPSYTLMHNVLGTSRVLDWAVETGVKRVVFSSSCAVYGDGEGPSSPYGLHKLMSELECSLFSNLYGIDIVCLRYYNVYSKDQPFGGAYSTVLSAWMQMIRDSLPLRIDGDGEQTRDFVHVDDIVSANIFCMQYKNNFAGRAFDVGTGSSISINKIKKIVEKYHDVEWQFAPPRAGDVRHTCADTTPLEDIGWKATIDIKTGIEECFKQKKGK